LATRLYEDPFDVTRPPWHFVIIDGIEGGRGAVFWKVHHTVSDGIGLIRLSEAYIQPSRQAEVPPEVDLDRVIAAAVTEDRLDRLPEVVSFVGGRLRHQLGILLRAGCEAAGWTVNPSRARHRGEETLDSVRGTIDQLRGGGSDVPGGSPLWRTRSRHRHLESLRVPLEDARAAAKALGGSINDFFVAGAVLGALAYHDQRHAQVGALNISFVVSTRAAGDTAAGGNAFTPTRVQVPGGASPPEERFVVVRDRIATQRTRSSAQSAFGALAGLANLLPTSVVTHVARSQVAKVDFATSNMRAAPVPLFISGAEILENIIMGPVAGTAFNLTALSYNGSLDMGVFIDPVAVDDPAGLRDCLVAGYGQLVEAGGVLR
jgi:hypothetical protein